MGYRDGRAWRNQQKQQQFGQAAGGSQRVTVPPPVRGVNRRDSRSGLSPAYAPTLIQWIPDEDGLRMARAQSLRASVSTSSPTANVKTLISFKPSTSATEELWAKAGTHWYNVTSAVSSATVANISPDASAGADAGNRVPDHTTFNKNLFTVDGATARRYNQTDGWQAWSATASGDSIDNMWGVTAFKQRIYAWPQNSQKFYYGSTDQIIGTLNPFDLSTVVSDGNIIFAESITRDGGSGPDDFFAVFMSTGEVVVYQGSDPADANSWSLVGRYKIGRPVGRLAKIRYGGEVVVLCEDDFYFVPSDFQGKRQSTPYSGKRDSSDDASLGEIHAAHDLNRGYLAFSDGTLINTKMDGMPGSDLELNGQSGKELREQFALSNPIAFHKSKLYVAGDRSVYELVPASGPFGGSRLVTAPLQGRGRQDISLVSFRLQQKEAQGFNGDIKWAGGVRYDYASAEVFTTASTSAGDTSGIWLSGAGTGNIAQFDLRVLTASSSADLYLTDISFTVSDTGGL